MAERFSLHVNGTEHAIEAESERIRRYVDAMFRFYVRSEEAWPAFSRDIDLPVLKAREAEFRATAWSAWGRP